MATATKTWGGQALPLDKGSLRTNIIFNDDCIKGMSLMPDESVDLIITDPPYRTTARGNAGNSGGMLQKDINRKGQVFQHNDVDCTKYAPEFYRILKNSGHCYVMTNHVNLIHILNVFTKNGFHFIKSLIWNKGNKIMGQYYMSQFEYILFFRKGKGVKINNCGTSDILSVPNIKTKGADGNNLHDTEKPIELMQILVENSSHENEIVLDPFVGVGSTALAAARTGRKFIGYELDKKYYEIACQRVDQEIWETELF